MDELSEKIRICMPGKKGKALAVKLDGDLVCETSNGDKDDQWIFTDLYLPTEEKGYHVVSANYKLALDYNPKEGEQVSTTPYNGDNHTIWYISPENEIFCYDGDVKKYLWSLLGNLYVTHDEYLAENWKIVDLKGHDTQITEPKREIFIPCMLLLIFLMVAWVIYFKNK